MLSRIPMVQDPVDYLVPSLRDSNLRPGGRLNLDPTQSNQPVGMDSQERSGVSMATIILHFTYCYKAPK